MFNKITTYCAKTYNSLWSPSTDVSVGIAGTGPESFLYYRSLEKSHTASLNSIFVKRDDRTIQFRMFGEALYGGRLFHYRDNTNFDHYQYLVLHYGKHVYSMAAESIMNYLMKHGYSNMGIIFIMTTDGYDNDVADLNKRYGSFFKSLQYIPNVYPDHLEVKRYDSIEIAEFIEDKVETLISMIK